jgi:hypothetical protein
MSKKIHNLKDMKLKKLRNSKYIWKFEKSPLPHVNGV